MNKFLYIKPFIEVIEMCTTDGLLAGFGPSGAGGGPSGAPGKRSGANSDDSFSYSNMYKGLDD